MQELIITHPGSAHFDEFFAICLVLAKHSDKKFVIERREPSAAELDNPDIWVIDIGGRYEPALKNFDHHQDLSLGASFVLVADYLGVSHLFKNTPWWRYQDRLDRFGPYNMAKEYGATSIEQAHSPFEDWFLTLFETSPLMVYHIMQRFGCHVISEAEEIAERFAFWQQAQHVQIKNWTVLVGLTDDSTGSQEYRDSMEEPAAVCVRYDSRGNGWSLYRFNDLTEIDFSRLEGHKDVLFAHKGGFIAKTKERIPLEDVLALVEVAIG